MFIRTQWMLLNKWRNDSTASMSHLGNEACSHPELVHSLSSSCWQMNKLEAEVPAGSKGEESACHTGDPSLMPGLGQSLGVGNVNWLQYSCLENSMDRGALWATVQGVTKSGTQLSNWHPHTNTQNIQLISDKNRICWIHNLISLGKKKKKKT